MINIVKGYVNGREEYRVYVNMVNTKQFETYQEAFYFKSKLEEMMREKASIATDEQPHSIDKDGNIHFNHEKKINR
jgi:hypothetical protein